jgi:hypothetical protein
MTRSKTDIDLTTRTELHRIATHVLARSQQPSTGRIGLRASPGGFSTIPYGDDQTRLRVSGTTLVRESATPTSSRAISIDGRSLAELADFADVDLTMEFSAGGDTPSVGDPDSPIAIGAQAARGIGAWFDLAARALDEVLALATEWAAPSLPQLWPEHFDLAIDLAYDAAAPAERRVNLGGSAGDDHHPEPYLYVGPWTPDRPGDPDYWNAPFGAVLGRGRMSTSGDHSATAVEFFRTGLHRLGDPTR